MFFISKKRICLIGILVITVILIGLLNFFTEPETIETVALPVSNKVIVVDAGHGSPDGGVSLLH